MSHKSGQSRKIISKNLSDIVLHLSTKFHKNRSNGSRVIASRTDRQTLCKLAVVFRLLMCVSDWKLRYEKGIFSSQSFFLSRRDEYFSSYSQMCASVYVVLSDFQTYIFIAVYTYMGDNHNVSCQRLSDQVYHLYLQGMYLYLYMCVASTNIYDCET